MKRLLGIVLGLMMLGAWAFSASPLRAADAKGRVDIPIRAIDLKEAVKVSYSRDIKPILANDCDECHSADDHKSGFDVSSVATLLQHGKKGRPRCHSRQA